MAASEQKWQREPDHAETSDDEFDCLTCGACCYQRPATILVTGEDLVRWRRERRQDILTQLEPGHFSQMAFKMTAEGCCVHHGRPGAPHACQIYEDRSETCRSFSAGSRQCREFRRDRGVGAD